MPVNDREKPKLTQKELKSYLESLTKIFGETTDNSDLETKELVKKEVIFDFRDDLAEGKILMKVVLLGEGAVGKTSIRNAFMGKKFQSTYLITLGADFSVKEMPVYKNKTVKFQI